MHTNIHTQGRVGRGREGRGEVVRERSTRMHSLVVFCFSVLDATCIDAGRLAETEKYRNVPKIASSGRRFAFESKQLLSNYEISKA